MNAIVGGAGLGLFNSGMQEQGLSGASFGQANNRYYVNGTTGNLIVQRQDQVLKSHGLDTSLLRTYNSQGGLSGSDHWYFRVEQTLAASGSNYVRTTADGFTQTFKPGTNGQFTSTDGQGAHDTLELINGYWVYTEGSSQIKEYYDADGKMVAREDAQGHVTHFIHGAGGVEGSVTHIINASGEVTEFERSTSNGVQNLKISTYRMNEAVPQSIGDIPAQITAVTGSDYSVVTYQYDQQNRLSKVLVDLTPYNSSDTNNFYVTEYSYNATYGSLIDSIQEWQGDEVRQSDYAQISFRYDEQNRYGFVDGIPKLTHIVVGKAEQAEVTEYLYDDSASGSTVEARRYLQYSYDDTTQTYTPIQRATTSYSFDEDGRLVKVRAPADESGVRHTTNYVYDDFDNVTQIRDNENRILRREYSVRDADGVVISNNGTLLWEQDGEGNYVRYEYNDDNLLIAKKRYTHADLDTSDQILPGSNPEAEQVTRYYYDGDKRLRFVVDASGRITETRYRQSSEQNNVNDNANVGGKAQSGAGWTTITYQYLDLLDSDMLGGLDANSNIAAHIANNASAFSSGAQITQTDYDFRGQVKSVYQLGADDAVLSKQHFIYDGSGRLLKSIDGRGVLNDGSNENVSEVDKATQRATQFTLNAQNYETLYVYDGLGRLLATAVAHVEGDNNDTNAVIENGIDVGTGGNLGASEYAEIINANSNQEIFNTVNHYQFDSQGGWTVTSLATDHNGDGLLQQAQQVFDSAGRLLSGTRSVWDSSELATVENTEDTTRYHYDDAGRLVMSVDPEGVRTHLFYDARGQLIGEVDGSGALVEHQYNGASQLERTLAYANYLGVAQLSRLVSQNSETKEYLPTLVELADIRPEFSANDRITRNLYDDAGRLVYTVDGEGYVIEYQYDGKDQLINTIEHSTPYEGYDYVSEDGFAIRTGQDDELAAFARLSFENGTYQIAQKGWTQEAYQTNTQVDVELTQAIVASSDTPTAEFQDHSYRITDGAQTNNYDVTYSVKDFGGSLGRASWSSNFNRTSFNGETIDTTRPENFGFVAFSGNQFGASDISGNVDEQPYFNVEDGTLKLRPADVFYEGDTNWMGSGNLNDQIIFAGTRQYDRNATDGVVFEYEFSQDIVVDNAQQILFGIGDEDGNQIGIRLAEEFSFTDNNTNDQFYNLIHFDRAPGEVYKIRAEVNSGGVQFRYFHKLAEPDANGNLYEEIISPWNSQESLSGWGDAIHAVMEVSGDINPDATSDDSVVQIHNISEEGALLRAPFYDVPEGLGYDARTYTHGEGQWGMKVDLSGDVIGEGADAEPFFNYVGGDLVLTARNVQEESGTVHRLIGDNTFTHNPSLPVSYKYYFSGGENSSYSRFFLGVRDNTGEQYGILFKYNDLIRATGISGSTYSTIDAARSLDDSNTGYLEFELVAGKLHVYYAPSVEFDSFGNDLNSQAEKVLVYEMYVGSSWGDQVQSVIEVRDHNGSRSDDLTIRRIVEVGTEDWKQELYRDADSVDYVSGITAEDIFDIANEQEDNYVDPARIASMNVSLHELNEDGTVGNLRATHVNVINPDAYQGEVEIYSGNPNDLEDGLYRVTVNYDYWELNPETLEDQLTQKAKFFEYVHNGYRVQEQTPQGASLSSVVFTDPTASTLADLTENYAQLRTTVRNLETGFETTATTDLSLPKQYDGYLNLLNEGSLADGRYTYSVEGIRDDGSEVELSLSNDSLIIGEQYDYNQTIDVDLSAISNIDAGSVRAHYWKTDGGVSGETTLSMSAGATSGHYSVNLLGLEQGSYAYRIDFLQQEGANYYSDYGTLDGSFNVEGTENRNNTLSTSASYWTTEVQETGRGITIESYLAELDGVVAALEGTGISDVTSITHLTATVKDVVTNDVMSVVTTDRSKLPESNKLDLMVSNGEILPPGVYIVEVNAMVGNESHQLVGIGADDPLIIATDMPTSNIGNSTRLEWDSQAGKELTVTYGDVDKGNYYEVSITEDPLDPNGKPLASLSYKSSPNNTFRGMTLGPVVQQGVQAGVHYGDDNLELGSINTQVNSYDSLGNYVNAGLTHDISGWYQQQQIGINSTRSGNTLTLQWDAHTHTQNFETSTEGFNINPSNASAEYDNIHAFHQDGQLLLRNTDQAANSELDPEAENGWYRVTGERHYTNSTPAHFNIDFNVGRAPYVGFVGLANGIAGDKLGIRIDENRDIYLLNSNDLGADLTAQTPILSQAVANENYQLDMSFESGEMTLRLLNSAGVLVNGSERTVTVDSADWNDYFLMFASAGDGERIGNPLAINQVQETGLQVNQSNALQYRLESESEWSEVADVPVNLVNVNGNFHYQADLDVSAATAEDNIVEVLINETRRSANFRNAQFSLELSGTGQATKAFSVIQDQSVQKTGTAIEHFFNHDQAWQYAVTTVTNSLGEVVDTVTTWAQNNDSQALVLNHHTVLANDTYMLEVELYNGGSNPLSTKQYLYTISDQQGTANQTISWKISEADLEGIDPAQGQVKFNYRVKGSTEVYQAITPAYDAIENLFSVELQDIPQGQTIDFLITTEDADKNTLKTYNGQIIAGEGTGTVVKDVFAVSDLLNYGGVLEISVNGENNGGVSAFSRTVGANDLVLSQGEWLDDGQYVIGSGDVGTLPGQPTFSLQVGGVDVLQSGEALPELVVTGAFDHYLIIVGDDPATGELPEDFKRFVIELSKDLSKSTFDVEDLNDGRYAFGVEYGSAKEVSSLKQNQILIGAQSDITIEQLNRFYAYTTQSSMVKQLSMGTRIDNSNAVELGYGNYYTRTTDRDGQNTTLIDIEDVRYSAEVVLERDENGVLSHRFYVPEDKITYSTVTSELKDFSGSGADQYLYTSGEETIYFISSNPPLNDYEDFNLITHTRTTNSEFWYGWSTKNISMINELGEYNTTSNALVTDFAVLSWGGSWGSTPCYFSNLVGIEGIGSDPVELPLVSGGGLYSNFIRNDIYDTGEQNPDWTRILEEGVINLDRVLQVNDDGIFMYNQFAGVHYKESLGNIAAFNYEKEIDSNEGQFTVHKMNVHVESDLLWINKISNSTSESGWEYKYQFQEETLEEVGDFVFGNNVEITLDENGLIAGKYKPYIQYYDREDTSGYFAGSPAYEEWADYVQSHRDQGLPIPMRMLAPIEDLGLEEGKIDGNSIILESYDAHQNDQVNMYIKLFDVTRTDMNFDDPDSFVEQARQKLADQTITRAFNINDPGEGVKNITFDYQDIVHTSTLQQSAASMGIQMTLNERDVQAAIAEYGAVKRVAVEFFDPTVSTIDPIFGANEHWVDTDKSEYWRDSDFVTYVSDFSNGDATWDRVVNLLPEEQHVIQMQQNSQYFITQSDIDADPTLSASDLGKLKEGIYNIKVHMLHADNTINTQTIEYGGVGEVEAIRVPTLDLELDVSDNDELYIQYTDGTNWWTEQAVSYGDKHQFKLNALIKSETEIAGLIDDPEYTGSVYQFRIIAQDADSGKEYVSSKEGGTFTVDFTQSEPEIIDVTFTRDIDGRETRNFYDVNGQLQAVLHADGAFEEYVYDGANRLIQTTFYGDRLTPAQLNANLSWSEIQALPQIEPNRYRFTLYDNAGRVTAEVDENNYVTTYVYEANSSLVANTTRHLAPIKQAVINAWLDGSRSLVGDRLTSADYATGYDGENQRTAYSYNQQGSVLTETTQTGADTYTNQLVNSYQFDALGRLTDTKQSAGDGSLERSSSTEYDNKGRLASEIIAGQQWVYEYDQNDLRTKATLVSDEVGNESRTTRYFYDANGRLAFSLDAANQLNEIKYNAFGDVVGNVAYARYLTEQYLGVNPNELAGGLLSANLLSKFRNLDKSNAGVQHANHSETFNFYNRRGELRVAFDAEGGRRDFQYNAFGDTLREIRYARSGNLDGQKIVTQNTYDKRGRVLVNSKDAFGLSQTSILEYDAFGRVVSSVDANGNVRKTAYINQDQGRTIEVFLQGVTDKSLGKTEYDAFGRTTKTINAAGQETTFDFKDGARTLTVTTAEGVITTTLFNVHGDTISINAGEGYSIVSEYDNNGRLERSYKLEDDDPQNIQHEKTENNYFSSGLLKSTTDNNGNRVDYTYDAAQRTLSKTVAPDDVTLNIRTEYQYSSLANGKEVIERISPTGNQDSFNEIVSRFDNNGRLIEQVQRSGNEVDDIVTHYQYDDLGQQIQVSVAATHKPEWVRDLATGDMERVFADGLNVVRYEYDSLGRRIREVRDPSYADPLTGKDLYKGSDITTEYTYDLNNNLIRSTAANGAVTNFFYDREDRQIYSVNELGEVTQSEYDETGNLIVTTEYANVISTFRLIGGYDTSTILSRLEVNGDLDRTVEYAYDKDNRLIFTRDAVGNVTQTEYQNNTNRIVTTHQYATPHTSSFVLRDGTGRITSHLKAEDITLQASENDRTQHTIHNSIGRAEFQLDSSGALTQSVFDAVGRVVATRVFADKPGTSDLSYSALTDFVDLHAADADTQMAWYLYDGANRQTHRVDAEGFVTASDYDRAGRLTVLREYKFSLFDSITEEQKGMLQSDPIENLNSLLETFIAEQGALQEAHIAQARQFAAGELNAITQAPVFRETGTEYDHAGRVVAITDAMGQLEKSYFGEVQGNYTERYTYDQMGNRTSLTNKKGDTWYYQYDALGRLVEERTPKVRQTRVQGVVSSADFNVAHDITGIDLNGVSNKLNAALEGFSFSGDLVYGEIIPDSQILDESEYSETLEDIDYRESQNPDDELEIQILESAVITMRGESSIVQDAISRNSDSSWQVDFSADNEVQAEIGLVGSLVDYGNSTESDGYGLVLVLDQGSLKVESRYGKDELGQPRVREITLTDINSSANDPTSLAIDPTMEYRAVFTVAKHAEQVFTAEEVESTVVVLDEDGNETLEAFTETVMVPTTNVWATLHVQLLVNDGGDWTAVSVADFEVDADLPESSLWVHKDGETDATAQLSIQTISTGDTGLELNNIQQVLPDARQGEWSDRNVSFTTVDSIRTRYAYDSLGNMILMTEAYGAPEQRETRFTYDSLGRQKTTVYPDVSVYLEGLDALFGSDILSDPDADLDFGYTSNTRFERIETPREHTYYDTFGNAVGHEDVRDNRSFKIYDLNNRLSYEIDAEGYVTGYEYDAFGNVSYVTRYDQSIFSEDPSSAVEIAWQGIEPPQNIINGRLGVSSAEFEAVAALLKNGENNRTIHTQYDSLNRKISVNQTLNNVVSPDGEQLLDGVTLTTGYEYDSFGRVTREWQQAFDNLGVVLDSAESTYHFYNELGQLLATVDSEQYISTFSYDGEGNLIAQHEYANALNVTDGFLQNLEKNESGLALLNLESLESLPSDLPDWNQLGFDRVMRFEYDALDRQVAVWQDHLISDALSVTEASSTDNDPHHSEVSASRSISASVQQSAVEYDALGNVVKTTDATGAATHTYYDALGRVRAVIEPERLSQTQDTPEQLSIRHTGKGTANAALEWKTPQLAGIENIQLVMTRLNDPAPTPQTIALSKANGEIIESADGYTRVSVNGLDSDRYSYEVIYTRYGDATAYGVAKGEIDVITYGSNPEIMMHWVDVENVNGYDVPTLRFQGPQSGTLQLYVDDSAVPTSISGDSVVLQQTEYGTHTYALVDDGVVVGFGTYQIKTGAISATRFSVGEATYKVDGKITEQQWFKWKSSKPSWKGNNKLRYYLSGFDHLGLDNLYYKAKITRSDAMGGTSNSSISGNNGTNVSRINYSERITSRKKYRDAIIRSLDNLTLKGTFRNESIDLIKGDGEDFETEYLEFYNLLDENGAVYNGEVVLRYRTHQPEVQADDADSNMPAQRATEWREIRLTHRAEGYYVVGKGSLPEGILEYQLIVAQQDDFEINGKLRAGEGENITASVLGANSYQLLETQAENASAILNLGGVDAQVDIDSAGYTFLAPLTEFNYDSLGNRVGETRYANGAVVGRYDADGYTARDSDYDQDRIWRYDVNGNIRQYQNAEGHSTYYSYDQAGNLRKEWSELEYIDVNGGSASRVQGKVYRYDANGQQIEVITLRPFMADRFDGGDAGELSVQQMAYNAFGEMVGRRTLSEYEWLNAPPEGYSEYFEYDNSGRQVRTNQQTGSDVFYLYDAQGRVAFEVRHSGLDWLHSAMESDSETIKLRNASHQEILDAINNGNENITVTAYEYDDLGRVVTVHQPSFNGWDANEATRLITPIVRQTLDRWGNTISTTTEAEYRDLDNGNALTTSGVLSSVQYRYNQRNQQVYAAQAPAGGQPVNYWANTDDEMIFREEQLTEIVSQTYYDNAGREIASLDANGNVRARYYDAAGNEVKVVDGEGHHEYQQFDALGNLREKTNALGNSQYYVYDKENRLIKHFTPSGGETLYTYDSAGNRNRIQQLISRDGNNSKYLNTWQVYDALGNVVRSKVGDQDSSIALYTYYGYDEHGNKSYEARGNKEQNVLYFYNTKPAVTATWKYDAYGRLEEQNDFGNVRSTYSYDDAGMLRNKNTDARTTGGVGQNLQAHTIRYDYLRNGQISSQEVVDVQGNLLSGTGNQSTVRIPVVDYTYDALGRQVKEEIRYGSDESLSVVTKNVYDGFGRLSEVHANSTIGGAWNDYQIDLEFGYDAMGNRRYVSGTTADESSESWYGYDKENRILYAQFAANTYSQNNENFAELDDVASEGAYHITYDKFGNRSIMTRFEGENRYHEEYGYNADNRHVVTTLSYSGDERADYSNVLVNQKYYDLAGRVITQTSAQHAESEGYSNSNVDASKSYTHYFYNTLNQQTKTVTLSGSSAASVSRETADTYTNSHVGNGSTQASNILRNAYDTRGSLERYYSTFDGGSSAITFTYKYEYTWFDDAKTSRIVGTGAGGGTDFKRGTTDEYYDVTGNLVSLDDRQKNTNDRNFYSNAQGQILRADWNAGDNKTRDEFHYYSSGRTVGQSSVSTETTHNWVRLDADETATSGRNLASLFKYKRVTDVTRDSASMMDPNFQSIGQHYPAPQGGTYTVQSSGERLESIAMALWGDSSLWYMLADENGLSQSESLSAGQVLRIPNVLTNVHNNSNTFKPYNPGEIIGNTLPDIPVAPPPAADGAGCGPAQIIVMVVAIVASVFTAGAALAALGPVLAGALGGAVGSIASQLTGMALGVQQSFSWSAVAKGAIIGGITGGVAQGLGVNASGVEGANSSALDVIASGTVTNSAGLQVAANFGELAQAYGAVAANAVVNVGVNYAVNKAFGDDAHFSWAAVAGSAVASTAGAAFGASNIGKAFNKGGGIISSTVTSAAESLIAREIERPYAKYGVASTESIAANAFGSALGNSLATMSKQTATFEALQAKFGEYDPSMTYAGIDFGSTSRPNGSASPSYPKYDGPQIAIPSLPEGYVEPSEFYDSQPVAADSNRTVTPASDNSSSDYTDRYLKESLQRYISEWDAEIAYTQSQIDQTLVDMEMTTLQSALEFDDFVSNYNFQLPAEESLVSTLLGNHPAVWVFGEAEAALSTLTSMVSEPVAGLAGLAAGVFYDAETASSTVSSVRDFITYEPMTEKGQLILGGVGTILSPVGEGLDYLRSGFGDFGYEYFGPMGGALGSAIPDLALSLIAPEARSASLSVGKGLFNGTKTVGTSFLGEVFGGPSFGSPAAQIGSIRLDKVFAQSFDDIEGVSASQLYGIPGKYEFAEWFDNASIAEVDALFSNVDSLEVMKSRLRNGGGNHEWLMVSRGNTFKRWGVSFSEITSLVSPTKSTFFRDPATGAIGKHGRGSISSHAHNEIGKIIDSSNSYDQFVRRLQNWAAYSERLPNGLDDLPVGLRP